MPNPLDLSARVAQAVSKVKRVGGYDQTGLPGTGATPGQTSRMTALPLIPNARARRIFLDAHALAEPPAGPAKGGALCDLIGRLGFVQVDSINTVARAHDMILYSRRPAYRPGGMRPPLERHRALFEHWTHDASIIPAEFFPHWRLRFARDRTLLAARWKNWRRDGFEEKFDEVLHRISDGGPVCSAEVGGDEARSGGGWWDWHPSKTALEYLWRIGDLMVTRREGFRKYYDLTERVMPGDLVERRPEEEETIDWACSSALQRLGFASSGEVAAFWDLITPAEARDWCSRALAAGRIIEIDIASVDGGIRRCFSFPGLEDHEPPDPPSRVRILSPFDPALRDRNRAERLFGFRYRIEIFVPAAKRQYGYYVFPVLEGDRLIGRIDMKCDRAAETLNIRAFWPEAAMGKGRLARLLAELERAARFADANAIEFAPDWQRTLGRALSSG